MGGHRRAVLMRPQLLLGTHQPSWLATAGVPLFVSHRRLAGRRTLPRAIAPFALDSGGFTELSMFGQWQTTPDAYVAAVRRYQQEIGMLLWAAPQDHMCEEAVRLKTGKTVRQHQAATVANFLELRSLAPELPFIPVLQGWCRGDYIQHIDDYDAAGIDLRAEPLVGVGSVCRRQNTISVALLLAELARDEQLSCHAFGVKTRGLDLYGTYLSSSDSLAWSYAGRREPGCSPTHRSEANCLDFAMSWRDTVLNTIDRCPGSAPRKDRR